MRILYISYDGLLEPLGRSQILAYLKHLSLRWSFYLLSFEKPEDLMKADDFSEMKGQLMQLGILWYPLRYHKQPTVIATAWDILRGSFLGLWLVLRHRLFIVHARGYVSSAMALFITRLTNSAYLFDMRGFWADEKLDGGWSRRPLLYRTTKLFESKFLLSADHIVSLTEEAVPIIRRFPYLQGRELDITVIPTCVDLSHFTILGDRHSSQAITIGYVGTATNWYLFDKTVACFVELLRMRPNAKFLIVNRKEHDFIRATLEVAGVPLSKVELRTASYKQMPELMARMHASVFFIKPVFSKKASSATKLGELLACGIPCMTNYGVGDVEEIFNEERIGVLLRSFETSELVDGLRKLISLIEDPCVASHCRAVAEKRFSLAEGVRRYGAIYENLKTSYNE